MLRLTLNALHRRLRETLPKQDRAETVKHVASLVLYVLAIPVAYYRPILSLGLNLLVTLIWIAPGLGTAAARR